MVHIKSFFAKISPNFANSNQAQLYLMFSGVVYTKELKSTPSVHRAKETEKNSQTLPVKPEKMK